MAYFMIIPSTFCTSVVTFSSMRSNPDSITIGRDCPSIVKMSTEDAERHWSLIDSQWSVLMHCSTRPSNSGSEAEAPTVSPALSEEEYVERQLEKEAAGQDN